MDLDAFSQLLIKRTMEEESGRILSSELVNKNFRFKRYWLMSIVKNLRSQRPRVQGSALSFPKNCHLEGILVWNKSEMKSCVCLTRKGNEPCLAKNQIYLFSFFLNQHSQTLVDPYEFRWTPKKASMVMMFAIYPRQSLVRWHAARQAENEPREATEVRWSPSTLVFPRIDT